MDQYIGKMLDNRYEILERIGTGGMAVVYKAKCHRLNRLVAVKILKAEYAQDEDFRRRFNAESQAVAQLSHANIMSVYDVSRGGDIEYIVMELIDGITLKQYMSKRGQLNWRESLHFITQIMRGLSHAHSRGIIHRDIKPQNIMVLRDGSVKVADFGIACLENSSQTLTQEALGSVHYISPEQAKGDRTDARSDIYSAGVVLYEMLAGRLPFEGDSAVSVAIQHLSSIPLAPREVNPDVPEQLELICMKAMTTDMNRRYPSAEAMIADLEAFRKNPGVSLDFELSDLRGTEVDEPTQPLGHPVRNDGARQRPKMPVKTETEKGKESRRDSLEPAAGKKRHQTILIAVAALLAIALAVTLFRSVLGSFEKPSDQYVVKSVLGLTVEEAEETNGIKDIFTITVAEDPVFSEYPVGTIAKQDPKEGEHRTGDRTEITVWLSAGEDVGTMIDVTKKFTFAQARSELKALTDKYDLVLEEPTEESKVFHDEIEAGYIVSTVPAADEPLKKGDTIQFVISKGKEIKPVTVRNYVGLQLSVAREIAAEQKLLCTDMDVEAVYSERPGGEIVWQSIPKDTEALEGDTIQFHVSSGLAPANVQLEIKLPQDRDQVLVEVYVGDDPEPQYREPLSCADEIAKVPLTGSGTQYVKVYFDGLLNQEETQYVPFG